MTTTIDSADGVPALDAASAVTPVTDPADPADPAVAAEPRKRRRRLPAYVVAPAVALALTGATAGSLMAAASFTGTADSDGNTFSSGTVKITSKAASNTSLSLTGMVAGDLLTAPLTVSNEGSLPMRYSLASTTSEDLLAGQLQMTVKTGVAACTDTGFTAGGTTLYGPGKVGSTQGVPVVGEAAGGPAPAARTVAAGAQEVLCVQVQLPMNADNSVAGRTTTATFTFTAEQSG